MHLITDNELTSDEGGLATTGMFSSKDPRNVPSDEAGYQSALVYCSLFGLGVRTRAWLIVDPESLLVLLVLSLDSSCGLIISAL